MGKILPIPINGREFGNRNGLPRRVAEDGLLTAVEGLWQAHRQVMEVSAAGEAPLLVAAENGTGWLADRSDGRRERTGECHQ
jgi:hypothetical protein